MFEAPELARDDQLNAIADQPDLILVGSLGRAIIQQACLPPSLTEKEGVTILRDIDVFTGWRPPEAPMPDGATQPNPIDRYLDRWLKIAGATAAIAYPNSPSVMTDIPVDYFEPQRHDTAHGPMYTFRPDVQLEIDYLRGTPRPKDRIPFAELERFVANNWPYRDPKLHQYFRDFRSQVMLLKNHGTSRPTGPKVPPTPLSAQTPGDT